jgi:D-alanyl-D-alanine carboxypeptidase (penicillin-binding protein 5/6)
MQKGQSPNIAAVAYTAIDMDSGDIIWSRNANQRLPQASITKVMTAYVTLRHGNLQDRVTIVEDDLEIGATMGLRPGDVVTVEQLLYGLLLPSANDAANALARHVGAGDWNRFIAMMNDMAAELGLRNTHFMNPHGLHDDNHFSTAADIATLARAAMQIPKFREMVATQEITVQANRQFLLRNSNRLLRTPGTTGTPTGIKTGWTEEAGDCLVASETYDGHNLITVVLNSDDRTAISAALLRRTWDAVAWETPRYPAWSAPATNARPAALPLLSYQRFWLQPRIQASPGGNSQVVWTLTGTAMRTAAILSNR